MDKNKQAVKTLVNSILDVVDKKIKNINQNDIYITFDRPDNLKSGDFWFEIKNIINGGE